MYQILKSEKNNDQDVFGARQLGIIKMYENYLYLVLHKLRNDNVGEHMSRNSRRIKIFLYTTKQSIKIDTAIHYCEHDTK